MASRNATNSVDRPFIVSVGQAKVDPTTRKLIRSHVMQGKNRKKARTKWPNPSHENVPEAEYLIQDPRIRNQTISRWLCTKFSGIRFAEEIEPAVAEDVLMVLSNFAKTMFRVDQSMFVKEKEMVQEFFTPLLFDPAYLYIGALTAQAFLDRDPGSRTAEDWRAEYVVLSKSIQLLSKRLASNDKRELLSDSTLMSVLFLFGHAYLRGDYNAVSQHGAALLHLVKMKGPHTLLRYPNSNLTTELIRADLWVSLGNGQKPTLFTKNDIPWPLILPSNRTIDDGDHENIGFRVDQSLADVWVAMSYFCAHLDKAARDPMARVTEEMFLHSMGSIMYRLLYMRFEEGAFNESFRLAILTLAAPVFLDWKFFLEWKIFYWINGQVMPTWRRILTKLPTYSAHTQHDRIWLLMVGVVSMGHDPDFYVRLVGELGKLTKSCKIHTWDGMRELLSSYMWLGTLYDRPGRGAFDAISAHPKETLVECSSRD